MRTYYLAVKITCDKCGCFDYLDNGSENKDDLNAHIADYYIDDGNRGDLCLSCYEELNGEQQ